MWKQASAVFLILIIWSLVTFAELEPEVLTTEQLPAGPHPHWIWINDVNFYSLLDGKAYLIDGDSGRFLGMLGLGFFHNKMIFPATGNAIYTTQTYYSRGAYGERTDFIGIYDARELKPIGEIEIPGKRLTGLPTEGHTAITDDDRFILISNFTPGQSVTVVDVQAGKTIAEIETPGCTLVYPTGSHSFFMICGDGSLVSVRLDDEGREVNRSLTKPLFDPIKDPIEEDGVRIGARWSFVSREGYVYTIDGASDDLTLSPPWSLLNAAEREASWRVGGYQLIALHTASQRLFVLMHRGGEFTHSAPAEEIWIYDSKNRTRTQRITAKNPATSVRVSQDAEPLLYTSFLGDPILDVYDARTGKHLRTVEHVGISPSFLQIP